MIGTQQNPTNALSLDMPGWFLAHLSLSLLLQGVNLEQTQRVAHRAVHTTAELLHEHDALPSLVAVGISRRFRQFSLRRLTLAPLEVWPPIPSWELRKQLDEWFLGGNWKDSF